MAAQRRMARRRALAAKTKKIKTSSRTSQNMYYKLMFDKDSAYKQEDITIGYRSNGDCEILFTLFKPNDSLCSISFDQIKYYRTDTKIIWPYITAISLANRRNLPEFVQKLVFFHKTSTQLTDMLLGLQLKMASMSIACDIQTETKLDEDISNDQCIDMKVLDDTDKPRKGVRYTHFLSIRIRNPLITESGLRIQVILYLFVQSIVLFSFIS